jgi:hypothetical protein
MLVMPILALRLIWEDTGLLSFVNFATSLYALEIGLE